MPKRSKSNKKAKAKLPRYVVLKFDPPEWHVRRVFPSKDRDKKGKIIYIQVTRRCIPETADRAKEISDLIEAEYRSQLANEERPQTVGEYIQRYLAAKKNSVARRTYEHDEDLFLRYVSKHRFAGKMLTEIGPTDVQDLIDDIQSAGSSPTMAKKLHVFLSSAFNQAVKWKRLNENPATGVIVPKAKRSEKISMSKAEVAAFLRVCRSNPEYLVFEFALETGMRPQEFLAITWKNLDLKTGKAKVVEAIATGFKGGGFEVKIPKTDASYRTIVISEDLANRLGDHRSRQLQRVAELEDLAGSSPLLSHMKRKGVNFKKRMTVRKHAAETIANFGKYDLVFPSSIGLPESRLNLNKRQFKDALIAAKINPAKFSLQSLRHTNLSMLAESWPPKRLQKHAGHARITTTLEYYVHVDEYAGDDAGSAFAEAAGLKLSSVRGKRAA